MSALISAILLVSGIIVGYLGQRSRMCFIGGFRDFVIVKDKELLFGIVFFYVTLRVFVILLRSFGLWVVAQPTFMGILSGSFGYNSFIYAVLLGIVTTLSGACPMRHHIRFGQGDGDSAWFLGGLYFGIVVFFLVKILIGIHPIP